MIVTTERAKRYLRTRELSERWGVSIPTLEAWRQQGKGVRWERLGTRTVVYNLRDVEEHEARQRAATEREATAA